MNERIRELSKQAWESITVQDALADEAFDQFDKKFAELIVEECAKVAVEAESTGVARLIMIHFGVEQ